ncbi:hypothetical protein T11_8886 [Trichinella zimbabwensis]|uniref:Uncharacterized protein n=1 Tax=Trichinella zimbabwensis TaxID=268475 RepID=A0A0V1HSF5_9BILA|nr:hypothetical protein T11_8886 [Trichinella zimbabwensis]
MTVANIDRMPIPRINSYCECIQLFPGGHLYSTQQTGINVSSYKESHSKTLCSALCRQVATLHHGDIQATRASFDRPSLDHLWRRFGWLI